MVLMNALGVHLGFGFSAGAFDYVINLSRSQKSWMLAPVGLLYFALYYGIFRLAIVRFDLKTPGRDEAALPASSRVIDAEGRGKAYLAALGGADNLETVDACTTRLRLIVRSSSAIDEPKLRALGAKGFVRPSANALQVVVGPAADQIAGEIRAAISHGPVSPQRQPVMASEESGPVTDLPLQDIVKGLGGARNIAGLSRCSSRVIARLADPALADEAALRAAGIRATARLAHSIHLIIGPGAADSLKRLQGLLGS
jgi:N-acetylglucosamine PTS system EIICBA or EIICB component